MDFLNENDGIDSQLKNSFSAGVLSFYKAAVSTILQNFRFTDHVLKDLSILMPENKGKVATSSALHLANRFSAAVPEKEIDKLDEEIILTPSSMLPTVSIEEGKSMQSTELCRY